MATTPPRTRAARGLDRRTAEVADDLDVDAVEDLRASAAATVARLLEEPARLGGSRLLCLDGPSGSGKTTLAAAIAERLDDIGAPARVVHLDDHYAGWDDLPATPGRLAEQVLAPLAAGGAGRHGRYDWARGEVVEQVEVAPLADGEIVVLEGVGAGAGPIAEYRSLLVWVEASPTLCLQRAVRRDGAAAEDDLRAWARSEARHFEEQRTRGLAQLRVDAWGRLLSPAGRRGRSRR